MEWSGMEPSRAPNLNIETSLNTQRC